ncbi:MAG TPA: hypothetical protein VFF81_10605 [Noviherbaspirillum sp.]|nr:hypothetical protein [Noviherbaspirillum sp.]
MAVHHPLNTFALPYLKVSKIISAQLLCIRGTGVGLSGRFISRHADTKDKDHAGHIEK